ncbi:hypothetical protein Ga0076813_141810, partial [endosymbiont of Ridgeia piscesae]|jgi:hypothetical protein
MIRT